jgi:hypothetical protein
MFKQDEPNIIKLLNDTIIEGSIKNDAMELGISEELIEKSKTKYPLKDLKSALDLLRDKIKANTKIKNLHAYFITLLETGVYDEVSSDELIEQANILEEKQKEAKITNGESRLIPFLEQLKVHFDRNTYKSWILHLAYFKEDKDCIYFKVPTNFIKEWMDNNLSGGILLCLHNAGCNFKRVEFIV